MKYVRIVSAMVVLLPIILTAKPLVFVTYHATSQYYPNISAEQIAAIVPYGGKLKLKTEPDADSVRAKKKLKAGKLQSEGDVQFGGTEETKGALTLQNVSGTAKSLEAVDANVENLYLYNIAFPTPTDTMEWKELSVKTNSSPYTATFLTMKTESQCTTARRSFVGYVNNLTKYDTCDGDVTAFADLQSFCAVNSGKKCFDIGFTSQANNPFPSTETTEWVAMATPSYAQCVYANPAAERVSIAACVTNFNEPFSTPAGYEQYNFCNDERPGQFVAANYSPAIRPTYTSQPPASALAAKSAGYACNAGYNNCFVASGGSDCSVQNRPNICITNPYSENCRRTPPLNCNNNAAWDAKLLKCAPKYTATYIDCCGGTFDGNIQGWPEGFVDTHNNAYIDSLPCCTTCTTRGCTNNCQEC